MLPTERPKHRINELIFGFSFYGCFAFEQSSEQIADLCVRSDNNFIVQLDPRCSLGNALRQPVPCE